MSQDRKQPRVFVVDDEPAIASTLAMILRLQDFDCRSFTRPEEALSGAKFEAPDLLITDIVMPGMSGIELALEFEREYPDCRILLFSGNASSYALMEQAKAIGHSFDILNKPVHPKDLLKTVHTLLNGFLPQAMSPA